MSMVEPKRHLLEHVGHCGLCYAEVDTMAGGHHYASIL